MNLDANKRNVYVPAKIEVVDFSESDVIVTSGGQNMGTDNEDWEG